MRLVLVLLGLVGVLVALWWFQPVPENCTLWSDISVPVVPSGEDAGFPDVYTEIAGRRYWCR